MPVKSNLLPIWDYITLYNKYALDANLTPAIITTLSTNMKKFHDTYCTEYLLPNLIVDTCAN